MSKKMRYITDSGHGWLEVDLRVFPMAGNYGTGFGYIDSEQGYIYLEEDCEMGAFLRDHPSERQMIVHVNVDGDAFVRRLPHNERKLVLS